MTHKYALFLLVFVLSALVFELDVAIAQEGQNEITAQQVRDAIDKGVTFLKQRQKVNGSWEEYAGYPGGVSAPVYFGPP